MPNYLLLACLVLTLSSACKLTRTPEARVQDGCVAAYDPAVDYFPDKVEFRHSVQLAVSYHKHYKVVTFKPSVATQEDFRYALVQCGTPTPEGFRPNQVITVPRQRSRL